VVRVYSVTVRGLVTPEELARAEAGVMDEGELLKPSRITLRKGSARETHLMVELTEGKNREIRRLFAAIGHEVSALKRISFGALSLGDLAPGEFRRLGRVELPAAWTAAA
jgi:23S rRNA pseudouridine2605 synthase